MKLDLTTFARNLNQRLLEINRTENLHWNYIHSVNDADWVWERCVSTAKLWDQCVDLEIEIEDLIAERRRAAA